VSISQEREPAVPAVTAGTAGAPAQPGRRRRWWVMTAPAVALFVLLIVAYYSGWIEPLHHSQ